MAWVFPGSYPQTREEAMELAMSVREEDIDYSDIPPLEITPTTKFVRLQDRLKGVAERNLAQLNKMRFEYSKMKAYFEEHGIDINSLPSKNDKD